MKNLFTSAALAAGFFVCSQNAFALKYICNEKTGPHTRTPIHVSVDDKKWDHVVVHRANSGNHSVLPCVKEQSGKTVCEVASGDPEDGGGCNNPYMRETFTVHEDGTVTYFYVNNGIIYRLFDYVCEESKYDGQS